MRTRSGILAIFATATLCASCGGPLELIEKSDQLDAEIADLEKELADVNKHLKVEQDDVSGEYRETELKIAAKKREQTRLDADLAKLRDDKQSVEARFEEYRRKHPTL